MKKMNVPKTENKIVTCQRNKSKINCDLSESQIKVFATCQA